jgi:hypothetical protein
MDRKLDVFLSDILKVVDQLFEDDAQSSDALKILAGLCVSLSDDEIIAYAESRRQSNVGSLTTYQYIIKNLIIFKQNQIKGQ